MTNIYPAPSKWFRLYLKRQKCNCKTNGSFEIWSNGSKNYNIANNCIFSKHKSELILSNLGLPFEKFEESLTKHMNTYK